MSQKVASDNYAAEAARQRQIEAAAEARRVAAAQAQQAAARREQQQAANGNSLFAERQGLDGSHSRYHFEARFARLDRTDQLDRPAVPPPPPPQSQAARDAVAVRPVATERGDAERAAADAETKTRGRVDEIFTQATSGKSPEGVQIVKNPNDPNQVELIHRDKDGFVTAREVAWREGDRVTLEQTHYGADGNASRTRTEAGGGSVYTEQATWQQNRSRFPVSPTSEDLKSRAICDPSIQVQEQRVSHDTDGNLVVEQAQYAQGGTTRATRAYGTQDHLDGIENNIDDKFRDGEIVDRVQTKITVEPPREGQASEVTLTSYSQNGVRATSTDAKVDGEDQPRGWQLETSDGTRYASQTFVEGQPDLTTITRRELTGNTVNETVEAHTLDESGDKQTANETTSTTFDTLGRITNKHSDTTDAEGVHTVSDYNLQRTETARGLEFTETSNIERTEPGEPPRVYRQSGETRSLYDGEGAHLISARRTIESPDGSAESIIDARGERHYLNGSEIKSPADLQYATREQAELATQAAADTTQEVKDYLKQGTQALNLLQIAGDNTDIDRTTLGANAERLNDRLNSRLEARFGADRVAIAVKNQLGVTAVGKSATGLAGLTASGLSLINNIRDFNAQGIAIDTIGVVTGGLAVKGGIGDLKIIRNAATAEQALDDIARNPGLVGKALEKFPRLQSLPGAARLPGFVNSISRAGGAGATVLGVGLSGFQLFQGIRSGDGSQIAQGGVGIAGAIGAGAAAGAIGGPLGLAAGVGIGLATFGVQKLIGAIFDNEHEIADVQI